MEVAEAAVAAGGVGGLLVNGCLSEAIFPSLVISFFVAAGDFGVCGAAQLELVDPLFFDPTDLFPKPRIPQLHFFVNGGRALVLISGESSIFVFRVALSSKPLQYP